MVSKTISLEQSAYERLKAAKRDGESFSDVVHRLLGDNPSLTEFHGLLAKKAAEEVAETLAQVRREETELQRKEMEQ
ncbi:MAG: antitoxin VapB family protein [Thermoplasmata archaeon]